MVGILFWLVVILGSAYLIATLRPNLLTGTIAAGVIALVAWVFGFLSGAIGIVLTLVGIAIAVLFNVTSLRQKFVSKPLLNYVNKVLPPMSETERAAIDAGTVWWEADLFQGNPDWKKLLAYTPATLTDEEQAFVDGPTDELCAMMNDLSLIHI